MKKFEEIRKITDWEVESDCGYVPIERIGKTIPYDVWIVKTESGKEIRCADEHLLFDSAYETIYAQDLNTKTRPDDIVTCDGVERVVEVYKTDKVENMYDIEVGDERHRYLANGLLCHNSIFLCNDASYFIKSGKNVLFITCEMSDKSVMKRISGNVFDIPLKDYDVIASNPAKMKGIINGVRSKAVPPFGALFIKEFPTGMCTVQDVENTIKTIEETRLSEGQKVNVVIVDYLNIMCNSRMPNSENIYLSLKRLSEDLRALAVRRNCLVVTATQANRGGADNNDISTASVSESYGISATVDLMLGIMQDDQQRMNKEYMLKIVKMRDGQGRGNRIKLNIDYEHMRITETGYMYDSAGNETVYKVMPTVSVAPPTSLVSPTITTEEVSDGSETSGAGIPTTNTSTSNNGGMSANQAFDKNGGSSATNDVSVESLMQGDNNSSSVLDEMKKSGTIGTGGWNNVFKMPKIKR